MPLELSRKNMTEYNKQNPFRATIKGRTLLNLPESTKKNYHLVIDLEGSEIEYKVGDAVGIFPNNIEEEVSEIISLIQESAEDMMQDPRGDSSFSVKTFLTTKANLIRITTPLLQLIACQDKKSSLEKILSDKEAKLNFIGSHDLLELLKMHTTRKLSIHDFAHTLAPMLPRLYSIASSPLTYPTAVELLISTFTHKRGSKIRSGLGSHYLCSVARVNKTPISLYLHPTKTFTLPEDANLPIIMIGPGTGIAPYRGFLQERMERKSKGKNWLFFGERNRKSDFYYEEYLTQLAKDGHLKLSLAFSRDQESKIYVQHLMKKHAKEFWVWMQEGAYIYVCGDAKRMAKDVNLALHGIAETEGNLSADEAKKLIKELRRANRYLMDVY